jgi:hypothetical protein
MYGGLRLQGMASSTVGMTMFHLSVHISFRLGLMYMDASKSILHLPLRILTSVIQQGQEAQASSL